jgi:ketosteroid isomerase-like protein
MGLATRNDQNIALARSTLDHFMSHNMDAVLAVLHDDVEARPSINGAPVLSGREAVARWWSEIGPLGDDLEVRPLDFEARGDHVIVRGYLRHRQGRTLAESQVFWLYEIHDGLIWRMESHPTRQSALASIR